MTKEDIYYFCTTCKHVHLRNSEIGKLHLENSFKTQKQIKEMDDAKKGFDNVGDVKIKKKFFVGPKKSENNRTKMKVI
jgi:hypothetical protein